MTYYAKRTDANHSQIMQAIRGMGATVLDLSRQGQGCPDLLISYQGSMALIEIKSDPKKKFTPQQELFMTCWQAPVHRIETPEQVETLIKSMKRTLL